MRPLVLVCLLFTLAAGCAADDAQTPAPTTPTSTTPPTGGATPVDKTVTVGEGDLPVGVQYSIDPQRLELTVGVPVNLTFVNAGESNHDLVIDGLDVTFDAIAGGESASLVFTPMEEGEFRMYCTIGGGTPLSHEERGMAGTVVVTA